MQDIINFLTKPYSGKERIRFRRLTDLIARIPFIIHDAISLVEQFGRDLPGSAKKRAAIDLLQARYSLPFAKNQEELWGEAIEAGIKSFPVSDPRAAIRNFQQPQSFGNFEPYPEETVQELNKQLDVETDMVDTEQEEPEPSRQKNLTDKSCLSVFDTGEELTLAEVQDQLEAAGINPNNAPAKLEELVREGAIVETETGYKRSE